MRVTRAVASDMLVTHIQYRPPLLGVRETKHTGTYLVAGGRTAAGRVEGRDCSLLWRRCRSACSAGSPGRRFLRRGPDHWTGVSFSFRPTTRCFPLQPSILADTVFGRYNTILIFSIVCLAGHIILTATSIPASLANTNGALAGLVVSILIIGIGAGSIKANVSPMIAEQYTGKLRKETLPSGEVVIKSPSVTIQSIYMWFYAAINVGAACAISASFLARDQGYWAAYLLPTCVFLLVPGVLIIGKKNYVITPPRDSILLEVGRVIKMAARGKWTLNLVKLYKTLRDDDFWDPAKPCTCLLHAFRNHTIDTTSYQRLTRMRPVQRISPGTMSSSAKWRVPSLHARSSCGPLSSGSATLKLTATTVQWLQP